MLNTKMKPDNFLDYEEPVRLTGFFHSKVSIFITYISSYSKVFTVSMKFPFLQCLNNEETLILLHAVCTFLGCKT